MIKRLLILACLREQMVKKNHIRISPQLRMQYTDIMLFLFIVKHWCIMDKTNHLGNHIKQPSYGFTSRLVLIIIFFKDLVVGLIDVIILVYL